MTLFVLVTLAALASTSAQEVRKAEARFPPVGQRVEVDGASLHYLASGSGRSVVLLHDSDGTLQDFELSLFERVAGQYRALALDRPGHGYSARPPGRALTLARQAGLLQQALAALGVARPVLVGHGYGASLALQYALDWPEQTAGLLLLAPGSYAQGGVPNPIYYLPAAPLVGPFLLQTLLLPLGRLSLPGILEASFGPEPVPAEYQEAALALWLRPGQFASYAEETRHFGADLRALSQRYSQVRAPTAILVGELDLIARADLHAEPLHRAISESSLTVLPDTGHQVHFQRPEAVLAALEQVWARAERGGAR